MGKYMEMGVASQIGIIKKEECELTPTELEKKLRKGLLIRMIMNLKSIKMGLYLL